MGAPDEITRPLLGIGPTTIEREIAMSRLRFIFPVKLSVACVYLGLIGFGAQAQTAATNEPIVADAGDAASLSVSLPADAALMDSLVAGHVVYKVTVLDYKGPAAAFGEALNNHAQIVGDREASGGYQAVIWNGRNATYWQAIAKPYSIAWDINDAGYIAGIAVINNDVRPVVWHHRKMIELGTLGGSTAQAFAINARGWVAGYSNTTDNLEAHATLWKSKHPIDLGTLPGGTLSIGRALNDYGDVVGYSRTGTGGDADFATLWKNGTAVNLGTAGGNQSYAEAINNKGQIVGYRDIDNAGLYRRAILWENGKTRDLGTLGGTASQAEAINQCGLIVGYSQNSKGVMRGTLWHGAQILDLNKLLAPGTPKTTDVFDARDINDRGEILAVGNTKDGGRFLLLTPVKR
jgi:probable HAF family extracellular repeat protein